MPLFMFFFFWANYNLGLHHSQLQDLGEKQATHGWEELDKSRARWRFYGVRRSTSRVEKLKSDRVYTSLELTPHIGPRWMWTHANEWRTHTHTHTYAYYGSKGWLKQVFKSCSSQHPSSPCLRIPGAWTSHWDPSWTCASAPCDTDKWTDNSMA